MSKRLRLYDLRLSRLPGVVGLCETDILRLARYVNSAQQRLLYCREAGDEGWYGTFAEIAFNVSRDLPTITLPRTVARLEAVNACNTPMPINNQFYEYLNFGNGRLPKQYACSSSLNLTQGLSRNSAPTFLDITNAPQKLRLYPGGTVDVANRRRVLLQGLDNNGKTIYSQDVLNRVEGIFLTLESPFVDAPTQFSRITGVQKDVTAAEVQLFQVDPATGEEILLSTLEPGEETAWYRRYYFDSLPCGCCPSPTQTQTCATVQVTAIAKLEPIPVRVDTDYLLIQNLEALIEECQSIRYSEMDTGEAKAMAQERHIQAVRYLNGEITHYAGKDSPAVNFAPFGTARLERQQIGTLF